MVPRAVDIKNQPDASLSRNVLLRRRLYPGLFLWLGNLLLWIIISLIKGVDIEEARRISGYFWLLFFGVYLIQAIPFLFFLQGNFKNRTASNLILVALLPFLILVALWMFFLFGGALTPAGGGFK